MILSIDASSTRRSTDTLCTINIIQCEERTTRVAKNRQLCSQPSTDMYSASVQSVRIRMHTYGVIEWAEMYITTRVGS